jgi:thiamine biosynthesis protein ThiS
MSGVPRLMLVTDRRRASMPLSNLAAAAVAGGVDAVQIREKDLPFDQVREITRSIRETVGDRARVVINGRPELAIAMNLDLHLPESMGLDQSWRDHLAPGGIIGRSVHSLAAAEASIDVDYLIAGHVFATSSKPGKPPIGIEGLSAIVRSTHLPVLAIGGITPDLLSPILAVGAHGVAILSGIGSATDPAAAARDYAGAIGEDTMSISDQPKQTLDVTINGKQVAIEAGWTIQDFLDSRGLHRNMVVVEHNGTILKKDRFEDVQIQEGDLLEVVHFVGGGSNGSGCHRCRSRST